MDGQAPHGPWLYLIPLAALIMIVLRNSRERRLRVEFLWLSPAALVAVTIAIFAAQPPPGPALIAIDLVAFAAGAFAGWWRGRFTRIAVDSQTHRMTTRASAGGMVLILGLFVIRYGLRSMSPETAGLLHVSALELTDALMLLAVGMVCAQRLEIALRATRMLKEAQAA